MNYYDARELRDGGERGTGKFHYTCQNDGRVWPVGYCGEHEGHATKEEAYACYKKYLLDNRLREVTMHQTKRPCVGTGSALSDKACGEWTEKGMEVDNGSMYPLCDAHRNRETVEKLFQVHQIISSY